MDTIHRVGTNHLDQRDEGVRDARSWARHNENNIASAKRQPATAACGSARYHEAAIEEARLEAIEARSNPYH